MAGTMRDYEVAGRVTKATRCCSPCPPQREWKKKVRPVGDACDIEGNDVGTRRVVPNMLTQLRGRFPIRSPEGSGRLDQERQSWLIHLRSQWQLTRRKCQARRHVSL